MSLVLQKLTELVEANRRAAGALKRMSPEGRAMGRALNGWFAFLDGRSLGEGE